MHKILIIDDDLESTQHKFLALKLEGDDVDWVYSPKEAIDILQMNKRYDVIILDIMMMNDSYEHLGEVKGIDAGIALEKYIRKMFPDINIVVLSARRDLDDKFSTNDNITILRKPLKPQELINHIKKLHLT